MHIGEMWFDNDPKATLNDKVARAADFYRGKYAKSPLICWVHPDTPIDQYTGEITIKTSRSILPNHFWIGLKE